MTQHPTATPAPWPRVIVHADMDAFFAAVEVLDTPSLAGQALIIGRPSKRGVVATASYEARRFGIHSAMPMVEALRRCPNAVVIPPRMERYAELSHRIMAVFSTFTPLCEPLSVDEAFLDMSGAERLFGPPPALGARLKDAVFAATGLRVSVGIATTKYVAKVASDANKPDGLTVVGPHEVPSFLGPLPVQRLWGAGPKTVQRLHQLGLRTIAQVAAADPTRLRHALGSQGEHFHALANGLDPRPVLPPGEALSIGAEHTLEEDLWGAKALIPHVRIAADRVGQRLRTQGHVASGVRLKLKTAGFQILTRQRQLAHPTQSSEVLFTVALELLERFHTQQSFRLVGVTAFDLSPAAACPPSLPNPDAERRLRLEHTLDALQSRFGRQAIARADLLCQAPRDASSASTSIKGSPSEGHDD